MAYCNTCKTTKSDSEFYLGRGKPHRHCKSCFNKVTGERVKAWRHNTKLKLMNLLGNKCFDCGIVYPPFTMDFDHRDPEKKDFNIAASRIQNWAKLVIEVEKCDLVCANCHRFRTHKQRCSGCEYC